MNNTNRLPRREALKWMMTATAAMSLTRPGALLGRPAVAHGYGKDPNVMEVYKPGDLWPLTFTPEQHEAASALCDVILPADERSPGASALKVPDFVDEWISAPYPAQLSDKKVILEGLAWLDKEAAKRFKKKFAQLSGAEKTWICDEICFLPKAQGRLKRPAEFFAKFRDLTMTGFYTTPEGMKDIQYLGNVPLTKFDGPPPEVLAYLKLS